MNAEDYYKIIIIYRQQHSYTENYIVSISEYTISDKEYENALEMYERMKREEEERENQLLMNRKNTMDGIVQEIEEEIKRVGIDTVFYNITVLEDYYLNQCKYLRDTIKTWKNRLNKCKDELNEIKRKRKDEYIQQRKLLINKINNYENTIKAHEKNLNHNISESVKYGNWKEQIIDNDMIDIYDPLGNYDFESVKAFLNLLKTF